MARLAEQPANDAVKDEIRKMRDLTDRPFGVNIAQAFVRDPSIAEFVIEQGVEFVTTSAGTVIGMSTSPGRSSDDRWGSADLFRASPWYRGERREPAADHGQARKACPDRQAQQERAAPTVPPRSSTPVLDHA